ncbi:hypothetical protein [Plantibacter sp. T3]|nr:hypothetical protein [Plantibacter sp. T3]VXB77140.1 hypothetical protein PLANTIT3_60230 [Plantibacter sp. T3]
MNDRTPPGVPKEKASRPAKIVAWVAVIVLVAIVVWIAVNTAGLV